MGIFLSVLFSLFVAPQFSAAQSTECQVINEASFTLLDLEILIRNPHCNIKSIDDVLGKLPERMRSNFVLFYRSQSLQGPHQTNYLFPRAILSSAFSKQTATYEPSPQPALILSFNGLPSQPGYNRLELVDLDPSSAWTGMFKYHEITFPDEGAAQNLNWSDAQSQIQISKANPARCVQCHGNPARPIFQAYPSWTGAFGSEHIAAMAKPEREGLEAFVREHQSSTTSRYRHINPKRILEGDATVATDGFPRIDQKINFEFGTKTVSFFTDLTDYNGLRMVKKLKSLPFYPSFKYAIAATTLDCKSPTKLFTPQVLASLKAGMRITVPDAKTVRRRFVENQRDEQFGIYPDIGKTMGETFRNHKKFFDNDPVLFSLWLETMEKQGTDRIATRAVPLRLIAEGLGYKMNDWWMDLKQPTYRANEGFGLPWAFIMADGDGELSAMLESARDTTSDDRSETCKVLAKKSREAMKGVDLNAIRARGTRTEEESASASFPKIFTSTCITCHVDLAIAPYIPFDDERGMSHWLSTKANRSRLIYKLFQAPETERMPPTRPLTEREERDLKSYLRSARN